MTRIGRAVVGADGRRGKMPERGKGDIENRFVGFPEGQSREIALASATATTLADWVLYTMTISKRNILGATAMACGFALGGVRTFGQTGGLGNSQQPPVAKETASRIAERTKADSAKAVSRLADVLKHHPASRCGSR